MNLPCSVPPFQEVIHESVARYQDCMTSPSLLSPEVHRNWLKITQDQNRIALNKNNLKIFNSHSTETTLNVTQFPQSFTENNSVLPLFKCSFCPNIYTSAYKKREHERTHTGERPFDCKICPYKSTQNSNLKRHVRLHHPSIM